MTFLQLNFHIIHYSIFFWWCLILSFHKIIFSSIFQYLNIPMSHSQCQESKHTHMKETLFTIMSKHYYYISVQYFSYFFNEIWSLAKSRDLRCTVTKYTFTIWHEVNAVAQYLTQGKCSSTVFAVWWFPTPICIERLLYAEKSQNIINVQTTDWMNGSSRLEETWCWQKICMYIHVPVFKYMIHWLPLTK